MRIRQQSMVALFISVVFLTTAEPAQSQQSLPFEAGRDPLNTVDSEYILGPGDQIAIAVLGYDEFTDTKEVLPDGTVAIPVLGSIIADGQTLSSLTQDLTVRLNQLLVDPSVTISLVERRDVTITVSGEVQRPGPIQLQTGESARESADLTTLGNALTLAGGVTRNANIREVVLTRQMPGGAVSSATINLWDTIWTQTVDEAASEDASAPQIVLRDGDAIFVPTLTADDELDQRLIAQSSLAPSEVRVRVVGEVVRPGEVMVPPNSSISSAVAIAGGPTVDASLKRVEFIRLNEQGEIESQDVDLRNLTDEFQIQEGDVVIVPERNSSSILNWAGRILSPFSSVFSIIERITR